MTHLAWLTDDIDFPDTSHALEEPNGLLAVGGDLHPERLLAAYRRGIFPWYSGDEPILWWSPSPRMVLSPHRLSTGRSTRKLLNKHTFNVTVDTAFSEVIRCCAQVDRPTQDGTWISDDICHAYTRLHVLGFAHSVETWDGETLVGGLYGIAIGKAFFGESMFSLSSGASKVAFVTLIKHLALWGYDLVDCQIHTDYLASFGASEIPRASFERQLAKAISETACTNWRQHWSGNLITFSGESL